MNNPLFTRLEAVYGPPRLAAERLWAGEPCAHVVAHEEHHRLRRIDDQCRAAARRMVRRTVRG